MRFMLIVCFLMSSAFAQDLYTVKEKALGGKDYPMSELKGKVVLIVNIASQCGYTPQLEKLETLYLRYKAKGLVVLGVPTNDFGGQTPEDDKGIAEFCSKNYSATFPILSKKTIQGKEKRDLYKILTEKQSKQFNGEVDWNFEKFLINKKGEVVARMKSRIDPLDKDLTSKIEAELKN